MPCHLNGDYYDDARHALRSLKLGRWYYWALRLQLRHNDRVDFMWQGKRYVLVKAFE